MGTTINPRWVSGNLHLEPEKQVVISVVAYGHPDGIPARFCAGLVPALLLSKQLKSGGFSSIIRVMDPTSIANYCNGWKTMRPQSEFRKITMGFFAGSGVDFFFDEAGPMSDAALRVLQPLGRELESSDDGRVRGVVQSIVRSGRKHGGESGARNATIYMAAHPFSWLDMHHPLIWERTYPSGSYQLVNVMSKAERRFAVVREFLRGKRPDLCTGNNPVDRYMTICDTPSYIPVEGEPSFGDLDEKGYEWCLDRYRGLQGKDGNSHDMVRRDFEALCLFLDEITKRQCPESY